MKKGGVLEKLARVVRKNEHLVPWILLALVGGATFAVIQILVVRLLR